jgi:chromate transporter
LFYGLKTAVLAVVLLAVAKLGQRLLGNVTLLTIAGLSFVAIFLFAMPFPVIIAAAAAYGATATRASWLTATDSGAAKSGPVTVAAAATILGDSPTDDCPASGRSIRIGWRLPALIAALWLAPTAALLLLAAGSVFADIALFFSQMAVVSFGGAYAVLVYVGQAAVDHYGWMAPGEMLDGLGLAETTPGPLIMVTQFVGYLAAFRDPGPFSPAIAGVLGAILTTWVTFVPCFLWIFLGAPSIERLHENRALAGALKAITAAVVGVVLNLAVWFGIHVIFTEVFRIKLGPFSQLVPTLASLDLLALLLSVVAIGALFSGRLGIMTVLGLSAVLGVGAFILGWLTA